MSRSLLSPFGIFLHFLSLSGLLLSPVGQAHELEADSILGDMKDVAGEYEGEIRLQDTDGAINQVLEPHVQISIGIDHEKHQLTVQGTPHLSVQTCNGKVGGIRELVTHPEPTGQNLLLKAWFDYQPGQCSHLFQKKIDSLVLFVAKDTNGNLVLETLHTRGPLDLGMNLNLVHKMNIHGFFTKKQHPVSVSSRS